MHTHIIYNPHHYAYKHTYRHTHTHTHTHTHASHPLTKQSLSWSDHKVLPRRPRRQKCCRSASRGTAVHQALCTLLHSPPLCSPLGVIEALPALGAVTLQLHIPVLPQSQLTRAKKTDRHNKRQHKQTLRRGPGAALPLPRWWLGYRMVNTTPTSRGK